MLRCLIVLPAFLFMACGGGGRGPEQRHSPPLRQTRSIATMTASMITPARLGLRQKLMTDIPVLMLTLYRFVKWMLIFRAGGS